MFVNKQFSSTATKLVLSLYARVRFGNLSYQGNILGVSMTAVCNLASDDVSQLLSAVIVDIFVCVYLYVW